MKDSGFRIRVSDDLRSEFITACKAKDITAAQVLREFMRWYVANSRNAAHSQLQLFSSSVEPKEHLVTVLNNQAAQ